MKVEFTVSLVELKRAFRRLSVRLPDESEAGGEFVVFDARHNGVEIVARETTEALKAGVVHSGQGAVSFSVFRGIARALRFFRGTNVRFTFSPGALKIDRACFRHPSIAVPARFASVSQDR